eukprot:1153257-Prymnesium_polylepis.1
MQQPRAHAPRPIRTAGRQTPTAMRPPRRIRTRTRAAAPAPRTTRRRRRHHRRRPRHLGCLQIRRDRPAHRLGR